jgi:hypothetical protein
MWLRCAINLTRLVVCAAMLFLILENPLALDTLPWLWILVALVCAFVPPLALDRLQTCPSCNASLLGPKDRTGTPAIGSSGAPPLVVDEPPAGSPGGTLLQRAARLLADYPSSCPNCGVPLK